MLKFSIGDLLSSYLIGKKVVMWHNDLPVHLMVTDVRSDHDGSILVYTPVGHQRIKPSQLSGISFEFPAASSPPKSEKAEEVKEPKESKKEKSK